jgi:hypothetical protein
MFLKKMVVLKSTMSSKYRIQTREERGEKNTGEELREHTGERGASRHETEHGGARRGTQRGTRRG